MPKSIKLSKKSTVYVPDLQSYKLVVAAVDAENTTDKIFIKQRIHNFARGKFEDNFVGVCTPVQIEDFPEDAPEEGSSYFRTSSIEVVARTPELIQDVFNSLLYEVKKLLLDLEDIENLSEEEVYTITGGSKVVASPSAPQILAIASSDSQIMIDFAAPANDGGDGITNYQYSVDAGNNWVTRSPARIASPLTISGLTNNQIYRIALRAVNSSGKGASSGVIYASPTLAGIPTAPILISIEADGTDVTVSFANPVNMAGELIENYEYSVDDGQTWNQKAPPILDGTVTISGLSPYTDYPIKVRVVTETGRKGFSTVAYPFSFSALPGILFTGEADSNWFNLANWKTTTGVQAQSLPWASSEVTISAACVIDLDGSPWIQPFAINVGTNMLTFNSTQEPRPVVTCDITASTGTVIFNGVDYGIPSVRVGAIFRGNIDTDWFNISNWLTAERTLANQLPGSTVNVTLEHACVVNVDNPNWLQPASLSIGGYDITFNSTQTVNPSITCDIFATSGTAIFNGVNYGA